MRGGTTTRLMGAVRRGYVTLLDDSGDVQTGQVEIRASEPSPDVEFLQPPGLTCNPPRRTKALLMTVGAAWEHLVAFLTGDSASRPRNGSDGDTALWDYHGHVLLLRNSGAALNCALDVTGDTSVSGTVDAGAYKAGGTAGKTGTLTITIAAPAPPGVAIIAIKKGIITSASGTLKCEWVGD